MARKPLIGHVACGVCNHSAAEVREDKGGRVYSFCPECYGQVFTRDDHRDRLLRARMRPVIEGEATRVDPAPPSVTETAPEPKPQPVTAPKPAPRSILGAIGMRWSDDDE